MLLLGGEEILVELLPVGVAPDGVEAVLVPRARHLRGANLGRENFQLLVPLDPIEHTVELGVLHAPPPIGGPGGVGAEAHGLTGHVGNVELRQGLLRLLLLALGLAGDSEWNSHH